MSADSLTRSTWKHRLALHGQDWLLLVLLAVVGVFALAGAFTHMHDWTIIATNEWLAAYAERRGVPATVTPDWLGWANAVTSEIMPTASLLYIRKLQRQGRGIGGPVTLYVGSMVISLLGQLSAIGVRVPGDAVLLVCLPVIALTVLSVLKFADMSYARKLAEEAELAAELAARKAARAAELAAQEAQRRAELAAELSRREAAEAAELERKLAAEAAELERRERREAAELAAELERQRIAAEQTGLTERARIEAAERQAERDRLDRLERAEADRRVAVERERARIAAEAEAAERAVRAEAEAALVKAQAEALEADAQARRAAAERLAAARPAETGGAVKARRPKHETQALVDDVLVALEAGTTRDVAVKAVAASLGVSVEYARQFVPAGWVAEPGSAAGSAGPGLRLVAGNR